MTTGISTSKVIILRLKLKTEREAAIQKMKAMLIENYEDLRISDEKIEEYNASLVAELKTTKWINEFIPKMKE